MNDTQSLSQSQSQEESPTNVESVVVKQPPLSPKKTGG